MQTNLIIFGLVIVVVIAFFLDHLFNRKWRKKERQREIQQHQLIMDHFNIDEKDYVLREDRGFINSYTLYVEGKQYHVQFQRLDESISFRKLVHVPLNSKVNN